MQRGGQGRASVSMACPSAHLSGQRVNRVEHPFDQAARFDDDVGIALHAGLQGHRFSIGLHQLLIEIDNHPVDRFPGALWVGQSGQLMRQLGGADGRTRNAGRGPGIETKFLIGKRLKAQRHPLALPHDDD